MYNIMNAPSSTTLAVAMDAIQTTMQVVADIYPAVPFLLTVDSEIVEVTAKSGTTFTVNRGEDGTTASSHTQGTKVVMNFCAGHLKEVQNGNQNLLRNGLINGGFTVSQRGKTFANPTASSYTLDRWKIYYTGTPTSLVISQIASSVATGEEDTCRIALTTRGTASGIALLQPLEVINSIPFRGKKVCFPIKIRKTAGGTTGNVIISIEGITGTTQGSENGMATTTTTIATKTIPLSSIGSSFPSLANIDFCTSANVVANNVTQLAVKITLDSNIADGTILDFQEAQLTANTFPLEFLPIDFNTELDRCRVYFKKSWKYTDPIGTSTMTGSVLGGFDGVNSTTLKFMQLQFAKMRKIPSLIVYDEAGNSGKVSPIDISGVTGTGVTNTGSSAGECSARVFLSGVSCAGISCHYVLDAEI